MPNLHIMKGIHNRTIMSSYSRWTYHLWSIQGQNSTRIFRGTTHCSRHTGSSTKRNDDHIVLVCKLYQVYNCIMRF